MSSANETISTRLSSETYPTTEAALKSLPEDVWCVGCGWDGLEDELMFTNEGVFVCPQCGGEDTDYFYSEDSSSCVFCGSDKVVGVIDIVSLNEIHEATPLDKEQVYGYCARCADVKMAEGSTGDQIVSWEDGAGVSSPSMPPSDIKWAESKKERIASGRAMHYAIPSEKKYPIWDKAHGRMALAWSKGTKYADRVEKAVTKRFPTMNAETVYRNYPGRKGPALSATSVKRGTRKRGNDGKMWEVRRSGKSQRWFRGAESFDVDVDGECYNCGGRGYYANATKSMVERIKDYMDEIVISDEEKNALICNECFEESITAARSYWSAESFAATGEPDAPYDQGYDDQQDESLGERNVTTGEQSLKDRRDEADAMDKKTGRKYHDVGTMDPKMIVPAPKKIKHPVEPTARKHWKPGVNPESRLVPESVVPGMVLDAEGTGGSFVINNNRGFSIGFDNGYALSVKFGPGTYSDNYKLSLAPDAATEYIESSTAEIAVLKDGALMSFDAGGGAERTLGWVSTSLIPSLLTAVSEGDDRKIRSIAYKHFQPDESTNGDWRDERIPESVTMVNSAENMGLTQYVGSAGGSSQGTPVSYGGIALPESDVASLVATDNPMDATIGTVTGTMGAEGTYSKSGKDEYGQYADPYDHKSYDNPSEYIFGMDNALEFEINRKRAAVYGGYDPETGYEIDGIRKIRDEFQDEYDADLGNEELDQETLDRIHELNEEEMKLLHEIGVLEEKRHDLSYIHLGAEEVPVVPDPSSFPQGYGRVLGQQTDQANLSPLHAEDEDDKVICEGCKHWRDSDDFTIDNTREDVLDDGNVLCDYCVHDHRVSVCGCPGGYAHCLTESDDWWDCDPAGRGGRCGECPECIHNNFSWGAEGDVQKVKIQDPVITGAKMALGVVALNATAIVGAALIGLALTHAARSEE